MNGGRTLGSRLEQVVRSTRKYDGIVCRVTFSMAATSAKLICFAVLVNVFDGSRLRQDRATASSSLTGTLRPIRGPHIGAPSSRRPYLAATIADIRPRLTP